MDNLHFVSKILSFVSIIIDDRFCYLNDTHGKAVCHKIDFICGMTRQPVLPKIPLILIIKHELFRKTFGFALCRKDPAFEIAGECGNSNRATEVFIHSNASIVIMDASIRPVPFAEVMRQLMNIDKTAKIIAMTNYYDKTRADRLMKEGAAALITRDMSLTATIAVIRQLADTVDVIL